MLFPMTASSSSLYFVYFLLSARNIRVPFLLSHLNCYFHFSYFPLRNITVADTDNFLLPVVTSKQELQTHHPPISWLKIKIQEEHEEMKELSKCLLIPPKPNKYSLEANSTDSNQMLFSSD